MSELQETDFGNIPKSWNVKKISDLKANDRRAIAMGPFGSNIKAENFVAEGVPVIRGTNLNYSRYVGGNFVYLKEEKADELIGSNCKPGDLVFTHRGTIGQVGLIPHGKHARYVISQSGMKLSLNPDLMDSNFLLYFFKSEFGQYQILKYESQVGVPSISNPLTSLKEIQVPVPKIEEQKAIASVLSSLDDKIDLLHRQNTTLERMAETLFRQWFVEEAQEDWEEKRIGDLVKVIDNRGKTPPYSDIPSDYPLIEVNALTGNNRLVDYSVIRKFVDEQTFKTWFRGHPKKYDSLLSTVGSIGEISMFLVEKGSIAQNVIALSAVNICPIYLFEALKNIKDEIKELDIGSVQPSIKVPHLLSLKIKIPSKAKIDNFSVIVKSYLEKMIVNYQQIQTLEKLRDNLLPKLMSGDIRIQNG